MFWAFLKDKMCQNNEDGGVFENMKRISKDNIWKMNSSLKEIKDLFQKILVFQQISLWCMQNKE